MAVRFALLLVLLDQVAKDVPDLDDGNIAGERVERVEHVNGCAGREQWLGDNVDAWTQSIGVDGLAHYEFARGVEDRHFDLSQTQRVFSGIRDGKVKIEQLLVVANLDERSGRKCLHCDLVRLSPHR